MKKQGLEQGLESLATRLGSVGAQADLPDCHWALNRRLRALISGAGHEVDGSTAFDPE